MKRSGLRVFLGHTVFKYVLYASAILLHYAVETTSPLPTN